MAGNPLVRLLGLDPRLVVGLVAGPALDGVDAALVEIRGHGATARADLLRYRRLPFPPGLREALLPAIDPDLPSSAAELSTLNFRLGAALGDAAVAIAGDDVVDLVACHGVSVWHQPPWMKHRSDLIASTLELGEPAVIAARTGAVTVGDFRVADVAVGGEGAPIGPYADWVLYHRVGEVRALLDVGAAASLTVVGERLADVISFDAGPGSLILDALARRVAGGEAADRDGALSARGRVIDSVLCELLDDEFLRSPPPRSTGRARYGGAFVDQLLARYVEHEAVDLLATAVALVAESIAMALRSFVLPRTAVSEVLVSGGGAHNRTLMDDLRSRLAPVPVRHFDDAGVPADARQAVGFALLGVETIHAGHANVPAATGARGPAVLGKICLPPA